MLSSKEKSLAVVLLDLLPPSDLLGLATTVTKNLIVVNTKDDARNAILEYSESAAELLSRKKMRRDMLFQYLSQQKQHVAVNMDKCALVDAVLRFWGSQPLRKTQFFEAEDDAKASSTLTSYNIQDFAVQFTSWFLQLLNSYNPQSPGSPLQDFGPQHFYDACRLKIRCVSPVVCDEEHTGSVCVARRLLGFVQSEQLKFNPNLNQEGVQGSTDSFGLTVVKACGTVHKGGQCIGIFKLQFGLVKDFDSNTWKIKTLHLMLAAETCVAEPSLSSLEPMLCVS